MAEVPLILRSPSDESEKNFIRRAWTGTYSQFRPARIFWTAGHPNRIIQMPLGLYYQEHRRYVDEMIPFCTVAVARSSGRKLGQQDVLAGFACVHGDVIHYVYTAFSFRRFGVARQLLAEYENREMKIANWTPVVEGIEFPKHWRLNEVAKWG